MTTQTVPQRAGGDANVASSFGARTPYERMSTIDAVFSQQARFFPHATAVVAADRSVTYDELDRLSNRVANHLRGRGIRPGACVGVGLERSADIPAVFLGILKAGAAYVPLDPSYPRERLAWMIGDASAAIVVVDGPGVFAEIDSPTIDVAHMLSSGDDSSVDTVHEPTSLAYIMYTSGSTGRPKGVAIEHRGVVRLVRGADYATLGAAEVFLQFAPLGFDASTFEIWAALLNGGTLAVPRPGLHAMHDLAQSIERFGVTTLWLTTAVFNRFVDEIAAMPASMRQVLTGGEVASAAHMARFVQQYPHCRLIGIYGPTENTSFSTYFECTSVESIGTVVPIGKPIANSTAHVVDAHLKPVPAGEVGELCVGGDGVGRGYVNLPQLTAERFVADPFADTASARLYRTGDRARFRPDGLLEFLGRDDDQVKLRGYRIELGEIEAALRTHPSVRAAAVIVSERDGAKELVAHVVPAPGDQAAAERALRAHLAQALPAYMLPQRIVACAELPLKASGKVDRQALAARETAVSPVKQSAPVLSGTAPRAGLESAIADVWREVLGRDAGRDENFFDAGGDSLRLLTMHTRVRERCGVDFPVTDLFEQSTIRRLAALLAGRQDRS